ncbi:hypothetical protein P8452_22454 [Trifolium repens]|nr:hypothetical protein P8452_22454 [Trifolium repens]
MFASESLPSLPASFATLDSFCSSTATAAAAHENVAKYLGPDYPSIAIAEKGCGRQDSITLPLSKYCVNVGRVDWDMMEPLVLGLLVV